MKKIILFFICIFLVGCVPPSKEEKTPLVKQTTTTTTIKKTKTTYHVFGKPYNVLKSSHHYEEHGMASWYGRAFHRRRTSSGARYNMYRLTAAHKTLPLSTKVLVTNLKNGRQVVVTINDRGPFISNRLIDLSYAAAKKINMVGSGLAPVSVKALA